MSKGLSLALSVPFLGVHHMQAHAVTPRLASALAPTAHPTLSHTPAFPFLALLASGGHTLLLHSQSLASHTQLATTKDIAIGDFIDKLARDVLPQVILASVPDANYGPLLEEFAFPSSGKNEANTPIEVEYAYVPPSRRQDELTRRATKWGWALGPPLATTDSGSKSRAMEFSFSGLGSTVKRVVNTGRAQAGRLRASNVELEASSPESNASTRPREFSIEERRDLAREGMRVAFEHLAGRVLMALDDDPATSSNDLSIPRITTLVVSGGVAANKYFRHMSVFPLS